MLYTAQRIRKKPFSHCSPVRRAFGGETPGFSWGAGQSAAAAAIPAQIRAQIGLDKASPCAIILKA